jgi:hypothetical protein
MAEKEYQRLTRSRLRRTGLLTAFATRSSLWLGKDHLLGVDSTGYTEEYKRFYFRDIQAVVVRRTNRLRTFNIVLGGFAMFFLFITITVIGPPGTWDGGEMTGGSFLLGIVAVFGLLMLINNLKGPGCACHLRTAVQTELLPSLTRLGRVRKVLARIRPLIEEVQGARLSPEEIAAQLAKPVTPDTPPVIARYKPAPAAVPPGYYSGRVHLIFFWLLLADVPLTAVNFVYESTWTDVVGVLWLMVTVGYAIASLLKQHNTTLPLGVKRLPWFLLGLDVAMIVAIVAYGLFLGINNPDALNGLSEMEDPVIVALTVFSTAVTAVLGMSGIVLLRRFRASTPAPAPESSVAGSPAP